MILPDDAAREAAVLYEDWEHDVRCPLHHGGRCGDACMIARIAAALREREERIKSMEIVMAGGNHLYDLLKVEQDTLTARVEALEKALREARATMDAAAHILCGPDYAKANEIALAKLDYGRMEAKAALTPTRAGEVAAQAAPECLALYGKHDGVHGPICGKPRGHTDPCGEEETR